MENNKNKRFLENLLLILLLFSIFLIGNLSFYEFKEFNFNVKPWIRDTYLLNYYDYGFLKRGLLGTILGIRISDVNILKADLIYSTEFQKFINFFSIVLISIIIVQYIALLNKISKEFKKVLIILAISPFAFLNFGFDAGRFDQLGVIFFLFFFIYLKNQKINLFLSIISPFFLFVQETNLFLISPFVFFYILFFKKNIYLINYLILSNIITLFIIFLYGEANYTLDNYIWVFHAYFDPSKSFLEKTFFWWSGIINFETTIIYRHIFAFLVFIVFNIYLIKKFYKNIRLRNFIISIFICYFPILLIAVDHSRYVSIYLFITILFLIVLLNENNNVTNFKISNIFFLIFFIGPFGVSYSLPYLTTIKRIIFNLN